MEFISYNEYTLNETYDSFVELKLLTRDIYEAYNDGKVKSLKLYKLSNFSNRNFKILSEEFLKNTGFSITIWGGGGSNGRFFPQDQFYICKKYIKESENPNKFPLGIIILWDVTPSTIIHELEHSWDNYRSKGKFARTKSAGEYFKELNKKVPDLKRENELYLRSAHEMSSFFVSAVNSLNFFYGKNETDFKPFSVIYDEFKDAYEGYKFLGPDEKKRLARKFSQYYFRMKERKPGYE